MKSISKQLICISIIFLLLGVSYTSAIRVENKTTIVDSEEDCGCNEVSDADIVRLEKQIDRLERYSNLLLVLSRYNPELKDECEELVNGISSIKGIFDDLPDEPSDTILCGIFTFLYMILSPIVIISNLIYEFIYEYFPILSELLYIILFPVLFVILLIEIGMVFFCDFDPYPPPMIGR
jgi:hypothetical protein